MATWQVLTSQVGNTVRFTLFQPNSVQSVQCKSYGIQFIIGWCKLDLLVKSPWPQEDYDPAPILAN